MGKNSSAPPPPDPATQIKAETQANRYNIEGPGGTQSWSTDPSGQATQTVNLNPSEQRQYDVQNQIAEQMLGGAQTQVGDLSKTPFSYNDQGSTAAKAAYQRQVDLLNPEFKKQDTAFEDRLANAGLPVGSEAYNDSLRQHENDKNFALTQAAQQAEHEGTGLALSERQQKYNEIAAALGSDQLSPVGSYGQPGQPVDVSGAYGAYNNAVTNRYNQKAAGQGNLLGGLFSLGSSAIQYSDARVKDDIEQVGELPTGEGVYEYAYTGPLDDGERHIGVLAQEIEQTQPDAVSFDAHGFRKVDYRKIIARAMAA